MGWILQAEETSRLKNYTYRLPDIAYTRARIHLYQGNVDEAAQLAQNNVMPLMQARDLSRPRATHPKRWHWWKNSASKRKQKDCPDKGCSW